MNEKIGFLIWLFYLGPVNIGEIVGAYHLIENMKIKNDFEYLLREHKHHFFT